MERIYTRENENRKKRLRVAQALVGDDFWRRGVKIDRGEPTATAHIGQPAIDEIVKVGTPCISSWGFIQFVQVYTSLCTCTWSRASVCTGQNAHSLPQYAVITNAISWRMHVQ